MLPKLLERPIRRVVRSLLRKRFERGETQMLLIVGHMRSGSTLLVHILANNKDIVGFGEAHLKYGDKPNLLGNATTIYRRCGKFWPRGRYVLDKVLHPRYDITVPALQRTNARTILLVREPSKALRSILGLRLKMIGTDEKALEYYAERLEVVKELAREMGPERCAFVTYENLVGNTLPELEHLTAFLGLDQPLRSEYDLMWSTGKKWIGDPSERIKEGKVVKQDRPYKHEISDDVLQRAQEAYDECVTFCSQRLGSPSPVKPKGSGAPVAQTESS